MSTPTYNKFCESMKCDWYKEWQYTYDYEEPPVKCTSCTLIGQSHDIMEYPKNCPYKKEIKRIILN